MAWGALIVLGLAAASTRWARGRRGALLCAVIAIDALAFTLGPLQPNYGSYFGIGSANINDLPIPTAYANYIHARLDHYVDPTLFVGNTGGGRNPCFPSATQELRQNLAGYRAAGVSYILSPVGQNFELNRGVVTLVDHTPTTNVYHLSGAASYFSAAGCSVRSSDRQSATVACPSRSTLIRLETNLPGCRPKRFDQRGRRRLPVRDRPRRDPHRPVQLLAA